MCKREREREREQNLRHQIIGHAGLPYELCVGKIARRSRVALTRRKVFGMRLMG